MFPDGHRLLDQVVTVLRQLWSHALRFQDAEDFVTGDEADLGHAVRVPQDDTNLGWSQTLLGQLEDLVFYLQKKISHSLN